ncbi:MAG: PKD domain-containing protein [Candidatus Kapabacteria bacterium]|nr:PKD domain-containing protein [Candidatus Kapabacteria bacterium]
MFVFVPITVLSQSNIGTEFWFSYLHNATGQYLNVRVCTTTPTNGVLRINGTNYTKTFFVTRDSIVSFRLPLEADVPNSSGVINNNSIVVETDNPVSLFISNYIFNSTDISVVYPKNTLGFEYFAICRSRFPAAVPSPSAINIVAVEDNTTIEITPTGNLRDGALAGVPFEITLQKGQTYHIQSFQEITGTQMRSVRKGQETCKPFAVFSGEVQGPIGTSAGDHMFEQLTPAQTWGKEFVTTPIPTRQQYFIRAVASRNNTVISINGIPVRTLNAKQFWDTTLTQAEYITSTEPISMAQFFTAQFGNGGADPAMALVAPVSQWVTGKYDFYKPDVVNDILLEARVFYTYSAVTLTANVANLNIQGGFPTGPWAEVPGAPQYSYRTGGENTQDGFVFTANSGFPYAISVYGFSRSGAMGLAYNATMGLVPRKESFAINPEVASYCLGFPVDFSITSTDPNTNWYWNFGDGNTATGANPTHMYSEPGVYTVILSKDPVNSCSGEFVTATITIVGVKFDLSINRTLPLCRPDTVVISAPAGFDSYEWNTGNSSRSIVAYQDGLYILTVTDSNGCKGKDTVIVTSEICCGNQIKNGEFEQTTVLPCTTIGFTTPMNFSCTLPSQFSGQNQATITDDASLFNANFIDNTGARSGKYFIGDSRTGTHKVYETSINVKIGEEYSYSAWVRNVDTRNIGPIMELRYGPSEIPLVRSQQLQLDDGWVQIKGTFIAPFTGSFPLSIWSVNAQFAGYDFGLDGVVCEAVSTPFLSLKNTSIVCKGNSVTLAPDSINSSPNAIIEWKNSSGQVIWNGSNYTFTPDSSGWYFLTVLNPDGCEITDSIFVTVAEAEYPIIQSSVTDLCFGETATLSLRTGSVVSWSTGETTPTIPISIPGTYYVDFQFGNGCRGKDSIVIRQIPTLTIGGLDSSYIYAQTVVGDLYFDTILVSNPTPYPVTVYENDVHFAYNSKASIPLHQFPITLPANGSASIVVAFSPKTIGENNDSLTFFAATRCAQFVKLVLMGLEKSLSGDSRCFVAVKSTSATASSFSVPLMQSVQSSNGGVTISLSPQRTTPTSIIISNVMGQIVAQKDASAKVPSVDLETTQLSQGVYFVMATSGANKQTILYFHQR